MYSVAILRDEEASQVHTLQDFSELFTVGARAGSAFHTLYTDTYAL